MHFTVNGAAYIASGNSSSLLHAGTYATYSGHYHILSVYGIISDSVGYRYMALSLSGVTDTGTVNIGGSASGGALTILPTIFFLDSTQAGVTRKFLSVFLPETTFKGTTTITKFDLGGGRVSGTFSATLEQIYPAGVTDTLTVTGGMFTDVPLTVN